MNNLIDNRQIRIFISSTFRDMQDERDYLMKRTFPKLRMLAAERDVRLTEVDLRWGITEEEAQNGKVVEICLREIENSIPFFVGIIGNRYGWIPSKDDLGENVTERFSNVNKYIEQHLSVTEMEMQFGVLDRDEDMHAFFYIKEQEDVRIDDPEKLADLKQKVKDSRYPSTTYSSLENLGQQVELSFNTLLDKLFPKGHISELEKERIGQRSFMHHLCQSYILDKINFQVLDEWMQDWDKHQLVITGDSGMGKSALVANWMNKKLQEKNRQYKIVYHFVGNGGSESNSEFISKILSDEIKSVYGWYEDKDFQQSKLDDLFIRVTTEGEKPLLIVLDGINQIVDIHDAKLLNWLPIPSKDIKILFSTLEDDRTMDVFKGRNYPVYTLQPLNEERRIQLVNVYLGKFSKKLKQEQVIRIIRDKQCKNTLVLKTILDELINFGLFEKLDERIDYYLSKETINDFYQSILQHYEEDYGMDLIKSVLSLIGLSKNGLGEDEIWGILNDGCNVDKPRVSKLVWSQFYCSFSRHINSKGGLMFFSHQYVTECVKNRYLSDDSINYKFREQVITYFEKEEKKTSRAIEELAFQYYKCSRWQNLYDLLMTEKAFQYLYDTQVYDLTKYWNELFKHNYEYKKYEDLAANANIEKPFRLFFSLSVFFRSHFCDLAFSCFFAEVCLKFTPNDGLYKRVAFTNLGNMYCRIGEYDKALILYNNGLQSFVLSKKTAILYVRILLSICNLYDNIERDEITLALNTISKAFRVNCAYLKVQDRLTASLYSRLSDIVSFLGNYQQALDYASLSHKIICSIFGEMADETQNSYNSLGAKYCQVELYDKALDCFQQSLKISAYYYGEEHSSMAVIYENIGYVFDKKGEYQKSIKFEQKALNLLIMSYGENDVKTAEAYRNISVSYSCANNFDKSILCCHKAIKIFQKLYGRNSSQTAAAFNNLGFVYEMNHKYVKAIKAYRIAYNIDQCLYKNIHPHTIISCNNIAQNYKALHDYLHAYNYFTKALDMTRVFYGENSQEIKEQYKILRDVCHHIGPQYQNLAKEYDEHYNSVLISKVAKINLPDLTLDYILENIVEPDPEQYYLVGYIYRYGKGVEKNNCKAASFCMEAAKLGHVVSQALLGYFYINGIGVERDYSKGIYWLEKASEGGNIAAQNNLAYLYQYGLGVDRNYTKAFQLYEKSAEKNNAYAFQSLAGMYYNGIGVEKNPRKAFDMYAKAASKSLAYSQNMLGYLYQSGIGTAKDLVKAGEWYLKSARRGNTNAQCRIGYFYANGIGVKKDYKKAVVWLKKSAKKRNAEAQGLLGYMYYYGYGVSQDYTLALELFTKSAEQGNARYQYYLAIMYDEGYGIEKNVEKSFEWYKKSAEQGFVDAYSELAWNYHLKDMYNEGLVWAEKAIEKFPKVVNVVYTLATIYEGLGRYEDALSQFELCLQLEKEQNFDTMDIQDIQHEIEEIKHLVMRSGNHEK